MSIILTCTSVDYGNGIQLDADNTQPGEARLRSYAMLPREIKTRAGLRDAVHDLRVFATWLERRNSELPP